jgi:hypothetical protein
MTGKMEQSVMDWLLEPADIGVKYLAMRDLSDAGEKELLAAKELAHSKGPIATVLSNMQKEGYWEQPGHGYNPKYTGTVWSMILLAQLGASPDIDSRVATACSYVLEHNLTKDGHFTVNGLPSGTVDCVQGNLCASLLDLGCTDKRLDKAFEWMARSVTGEGVAPMTDKKAPLRYYSGKTGPNFRCGGNNKLPCAWGAVKVMLAFGKLPEEKRTGLVNNAIKTGIDFLLGKDPAVADYPCGYNQKPSGNWWKFGFPVFYVTDILQNVEALVQLGLGPDPRLAHALNIIREKRDAKGRWTMEYDYTGKTWADFGAKKQPNKWVTLRALRVLKTLE